MALPSGSSSGRGAGGVVSSVGYIGVVEAAMRSVGVEPAEEECDPLVVAALMECSRRKNTATAACIYITCWLPFDCCHYFLFSMLNLLRRRCLGDPA